jgi:hypothetical protein
MSNREGVLAPKAQGLLPPRRFLFRSVREESGARSGHMSGEMPLTTSVVVTTRSGDGCLPDRRPEERTTEQAFRDLENRWRSPCLACRELAWEGVGASLNRAICPSAVPPGGTTEPPCGKQRRWPGPVSCFWTPISTGSVWEAELRIAERGVSTWNPARLSGSP